MPLRRGADALTGAIDKAKAGGENRTPTNFFSWKDGETKIIRFLTDRDEVFVTNVHDYLLCPDGKRRTFVCRKDVEAPTCELCGAEGVTRKETAWGIAVLREEVREEVDGRMKVVGYRDFTEEYDDGGTKKLRPFVGIVRQAPTNFWLYVDEVYQRRGSLLEFDLDIKRKGADKSTAYIVYPCDPVKIDNIEERYKKFVPDLAAMLETMASEEYYKTHLHGTGQAGEATGSPAASSPSPAAPSTPSGGDALDERSEFDRLKEQQAKLLEQASSGATY